MERDADVILLYTLIDGLWRALGQTSVTPPAPPATGGGYGAGGYGSAPYGG